jgi:hypothetical protein
LDDSLLRALAQPEGSVTKYVTATSLAVVFENRVLHVFSLRMQWRVIYQTVCEI